MVPLLLHLIFSPPLFMKAMSVISVASLGHVGLSEIRGEHMQYSKFLNVGAKEKKKNNNSGNSKYQMQIQLSSRTGMLLAYTPAFLAAVASFGIFPDEGLRFLLVRSALTLHFLKRILEVLFIHRYSGGMEVESLIPISLTYFTSTLLIIYSQHLTQGHPEPAFDTRVPGIVLFLIGIAGNFYHHLQLSKLRSESEDEYKVPQGGLFRLVICPHYLFEILGFLGIAFIAQTLYAFAYTTGSALYLMGRSYATKRWYLSKFSDFCKDVKALIPFVF